MWRLLLLLLLIWWVFEKRSAAAGASLLTMRASRRLVDHQLEVDRAAPFHSVVDDVVRPGLALDVDQYAVCAGQQMEK